MKLFFLGVSVASIVQIIAVLLFAFIWIGLVAVALLVVALSIGLMIHAFREPKPAKEISEEEYRDAVHQL